MLKIDGIFQVRNVFSKPVIKVWYEPMTGGLLSLISHFTFRFCGMILYFCVDILLNQLLTDRSSNCRIQEQVLVVWSHVEARTLAQVSSTKTGAIHAQKLPVCQGIDDIPYICLFCMSQKIREKV